MEKNTWSKIKQQRITSIFSLSLVSLLFVVIHHSLISNNVPRTSAVGWCVGRSTRFDGDDFELTQIACHRFNFLKVDDVLDSHFNLPFVHRQVEGEYSLFERHQATFSD